MKWLNKFKISLPPLPAPPPMHAPDRTTLLQLAFVILIAVIAHFSIAKPFIAVFTLLIWSLKTGMIYQQYTKPSKFLVMMLTIVSIAMILLLYGGWNSQKAGISFLVILASLKFLEANTLRDYYVVCLLLFFLASSSFLFNSSLLNIIAVLIYVVLVTALLLKISSPTPVKLRSSLLSAGVITLKALPLAVFLFFFFPRVQGSFGFIPSQDDINSDNELSDSLVAGDFASGAFNNSPAFRVEFDGIIPSNNLLYWRVKVMTKEQNFQWQVTPPSPEQLRLAQLRQAPQPKTATVSYRIVHEDSNDSYAPFLDYVSSQKLGQQLQNHSVFLSKKPDGIFAYRGSSTALPQFNQTENINTSQLLTTLSTPKARTLELLSKWRRETNNDKELVNAVFQHFAKESFHYSLEPPSLGENPVDEFLFDSQTGYCEHYASTFTILMRWLGIPARVVVGYQGGEYNSVGNYLQVRYSDAHTWSEVWLNGQWQRVDPTAAINPDRIEYGMDAWMEYWLDNSIGGNATGRALADYLNPTGFVSALRKVRDNWDNVGYQWDKWVVNYDFDSQKKLLESLGLRHKDSLITLIGIVAAGTMLLMLFCFWQLIPKAIKIGEAQAAYLNFVAKFKHHGINKALSDTPSEFAEAAIAGFPNQAKGINEITKLYLKLRYGRPLKNKESSDLKDLKLQIKKFKVLANH